MSRINIGKDFSRYPVGRYLRDGDSNGEKFREDLLRPALVRGDVEVLLDDAFGYGSSFLEEAFGGLVRSGMTLSELKQRLRIVTVDHSLETEIWRYIEEASKKRK